MKTDYTKVDALILNAISDKPVMFVDIFINDVRIECDYIVSSPELFDKPPCRVLDGRLQALKRIGKIRSTTKGWIRVGGQPDTTESGK